MNLFKRKYVKEVYFKRLDSTFFQMKIIRNDGKEFKELIQNRMEFIAPFINELSNESKKYIRKYGNDKVIFNQDSINLLFEEADKFNHFLNKPVYIIDTDDSKVSISENNITFKWFEKHGEESGQLNEVELNQIDMNEYVEILGQVIKFMYEPIDEINSHVIGFVTDDITIEEEVDSNIEFVKNFVKKTIRIEIIGNKDDNLIYINEFINGENGKDGKVIQMIAFDMESCSKFVQNIRKYQDEIAYEFTINKEN